MPLSVYNSKSDSIWPMGFVGVANNGTPVCIMTNVDGNNVHAPESKNSEWAWSVRALGLQGYHPGNNNNGMVINTGNVYLMMKPVGGNGNRTDSGAIVKVIPPGGDLYYPIDPTGGVINPYGLYFDVDVNGEGALVTGYQGV